MVGAAAGSDDSRIREERNIGGVMRREFVARMRVPLHLDREAAHALPADNPAAMECLGPETL
jgi:hypothetical protein